jgi:hypothetical protein
LRDAGRRVIGCGNAGNTAPAADRVDGLQKPIAFVHLVIAEIMNHRRILRVVDEIVDEARRARSSPMKLRDENAF